MVTLTTDDYLQALDTILQKHYPKTSYSLSGYQEWSVCLQYADSAWLVYYAERGNHYDETKCKTVLETGLTIIRKFTHRTEDIAFLENEFLDCLYRAKSA